MDDEELYSRACHLMPGGVNSPVRAFGAVGISPVFMESGHGPWLVTRDGRRLVDCIGSWGALLFGHAPQPVADALIRQIPLGTSFGACTEGEVSFAEEIQGFFPSMEMLRLVNSGTEATLSAIRLARGATGRPRIVKFRGCYHGHGDSFLIQAGSGALTHGVPSSAGVTAATAADTLVAPYNHLEAVESLFRSQGDSIACVILEPVAGNMGVVPPAQGFLLGLRELCTRYGALLIFDEVMTGFRVAPGGAQERYGIKPDLTTLAKILGAGMPIGAYGGRRDLMERVSPLGPVYQAGTLSGNPMAVAAGRAHLSMIRELRPHAALEEQVRRVASGIRTAAQDAGIAVQVNQVGSMFTVFFAQNPVTDDASAMAASAELYGHFFRGMLERGVYLAPSQYESLFLSAAHGPAELEQIVESARDVFRNLPRQ